MTPTPARPVRRALLLLALAAACDRSSSQGGGLGERGASPSGGPGVPDETLVPREAVPPVGLTWNVGFTEPTPLPAMQEMFTRFVTLNELLWDVSEGQVHLAKIRFFDAVAPGTKASIQAGLKTPTLDVVLWPRSQWDLPTVAGYVLFLRGQPGVLARTDRRIQIPVDAADTVLLHEASHAVWSLSWSGNDLPPGLDDEYKYLPNDPACMMDLEPDPPRWCSGGGLPASDHIPKNGGQGARSCWEQILADYPFFAYHGTNGASRTPPPPDVEFNPGP